MFASWHFNIGPTHRHFRALRVDWMFLVPGLDLGHRGSLDHCSVVRAHSGLHQHSVVADDWDLGFMVDLAAVVPEQTRTPGVVLLHKVAGGGAIHAGPERGSRTLHAQLQQCHDVHDILHGLQKQLLPQPLSQDRIRQLHQGHRCHVEWHHHSIQSLAGNQVGLRSSRQEST